MKNNQATKEDIDYYSKLKEKILSTIFVKKIKLHSI